MMRWPSAYCAMSSGMSRSIMRSSTQPTWPEVVRTRYQSSIATAGLGGGGCSVAFAPAAVDFTEPEASVVGGWDDAEAGGVGFCAFAGLADFFWLALVFDGVVAAGFGGLGAFFSAVARRTTSTFSPSLS